jgi:hypothetical protein
MKALAPAWAMGALALHARGDTNLVDGIHYRLFTDPRLGLPMRPVYVARVNFGPDAKNIEPPFPAFPPLRHEVTWIDSRGRYLVAPFNVTPDNPVTGTLPTHAFSRCIWLKVDSSPRSDLRADIFRTTARGPRPLGARDTAPLSLGASDIDGVIISGEGTVRDLTWLDIWRYPGDWDSLYQMALPRDNRARYEDPMAGSSLLRAALRVERGAPRRFGLHDEPAAPDAASTSIATLLDEAAKLAALAPGVAGALDALLDDLSAPQHALEQSEQLTEGDPTEPPEATWLATDLVHTAMHDPTMARWLGFMDVELPADLDPDPDDVVLYDLTSWWAIDPTALTPVEQLSFLPALPGLLLPDQEYFDPSPAWDESPDGLPIFKLTVSTVAVGHAPPLRPAPPVVDPELSPGSPATPDGLGPWLPAEPPAARRQAVIPVRGLAPAAGLAYATEADSVIEGMNERVPVARGTVEDRARLIVPAVPRGATESGTGRLLHRTVPAEGLTVRVAQSDVFGRWSDWGERDLAAKTRPGPPEPVCDVWYAIADPDAAGSGPRWGSLTARVQVPPPAERAPGSRLLDRISLSGTVGAHAFTVEADAPDPQEGELVVEIPRPHDSLLRLGAVVEAVTTARWIDTDGVESVESAPRITQCADGRPPVVVAEPPLLEWTARPDALGRARVKLAWTPTGAQDRFRVFGCDEQRLVHKATELRDEGDEAYGAFLTALDEAADRPARAQVLRDHHGLFDREWFQSLTDDPIERSGSAELSFQHDLSGSLGVLAVYKVVAETEAGTGADFAATPLWVWAVPERSGPPRPLLDVLETSDGPPRAVTLRLRLTGRAEDAGRYRLRRSAVHSDPRRMPVAQVGDIVLVPGQKYCDIVDDGSFVHDPAYELQTDTVYSWTVEVQSPDLPGSTRPGAWSEPSTAVATKILGPYAADAEVVA